jgi:hypothetical protein
VTLPNGQFAVGHVKVQPEYVQDRLNWNVALSGNWLVASNDTELLKNLLADHVLVVFNESESNASLELIQDIERQSVVTLRDACLAEFERIHEVWTAHVAEQPSKRKNLVAPNKPRLPEIASDENAVSILTDFGKSAFSMDTPMELRELIARGRLLKLFADAWIAVESDRTNRKFLNLVPQVIRPTPFHPHVTE